MLRTRFSLLFAAIILLWAVAPIWAQHPTSTDLFASANTPAPPVVVPPTPTPSAVKVRLAKTTAASTLQFAVEQAAQSLQAAQRHALATRWVEADAAYARAVQLYRSAATGDADAYALAAGAAYEAQATYYQSRERWNEAETAYGLAGQLYQQRVLKGDAQAWTVLAKCATTLATLYQMQDKNALAIDAYTQALEAYTFLAGQRSPGALVARSVGKAAVLTEHDYTADLYNTALALGMLHQVTGNLVAAEPLLQQALQGYTQLAKRENAHFEAQLALAAGALAHYYQAANNPPQAEQYYLQAVAVYERLARTEPNRYTGAQRSALRNLASFYGRTGNAAAAQVYFAKAEARANTSLGAAQR